MQVEKLEEIIRIEKKCPADEALQVVALLGMADAGEPTDPDQLKKAAFEMWETQFGQSTRNRAFARCGGAVNGHRKFHQISRL